MSDLLDGKGIHDFLFGDKPTRPRTFQTGDRVKTRHTTNPPTDWTPEAARLRRFEVEGTVIQSHNGHGLCYSVRHENGTVGTYEPQELELLPLGTPCMAPMGNFARTHKAPIVANETATVAGNPSDELLQQMKDQGGSTPTPGA